MDRYVWSLIATVFQKWKTIQGYALPPHKGSHLHPKCGSRPIKEMVQDRHVTNLLRTSNRKYGLSTCAISSDLGWRWRSFASCTTYQMQFNEHLCDISRGFNWHGASRGLSAIAELLVICGRNSVQNRAPSTMALSFSFFGSLCCVGKGMPSPKVQNVREYMHRS